MNLKEIISENELPTGGDCFKVAYREITSGELSQIPGVRLIHADTDRIGHHAWVEMGDVVFDQSNGNNYVGRKEQYYDHFGVHPDDPNKFTSYTVQETFEQAVKYGTYGPWT